MSRVLFGDLETASAADLKRTGAEKYFEHASTRVLCAAFAFDDQPTFGFLIGPDGRAIYEEDRQYEVAKHIAGGGTFVAHNASFELPGMARLHRDFPKLWPALRPEQTHCTMAMCRAMGLPGALADAAKALRLKVEKDLEGRKLMMKLCKPRKPRRGEDPNAILWDHHTPEALQRLLEYCEADIEPERAIWNLLPKLSERERAYWIIDRRINDRGILIDVEGATTAANACGAAKQELDAQMRRLTRGRVSTVGQVAEIVKLLNEKGLDVPNLQKRTIENLMARKDVRGFARRVLALRQEASKSSTSKLDAALAGAMEDCRLRGTIIFHGAGTGRPTGRGFQPLNMIRPPKGFTRLDAAEVIDWLKVPGGERYVRAQHKSVISAVAHAMRAFVLAAEGKVLAVADYSNIEGRKLAWKAGEEWKLKAFRDFDAGNGFDLYVLAYAKAFGVPPEAVDDLMRQIGKVMELALGYQGAHGAFLSMGKNYGIDLDQIAKAVREAVSQGVWGEAMERYWRGAYESAEEMLAARRLEADLNPTDVEPDFFDLAKEIARGNRHNLEADHWVAIRIIVDGWRAAHPKVVTLWKAVESAAIEAVERPGIITHAGRLSFCKTGSFLQMRLPSGRKLSYAYARTEMQRSKWREDKLDKKLVYEGVDPKSKKWSKQHAYGGQLVENGCQGSAFDLLKDAQFRLEAAGMPVVLHVYDENVCEVEPREGLADDLRRLMLASEKWAEGLPVAIGKPMISDRYWKG